MANADAIKIKAVVDGTTSAVSNTGARLYHSGRIFVASGIRNCYISCDAMRNLRIINKHFHLPGSSDAPSCSLCVAAARTDKIVGTAAPVSWLCCHTTHIMSHWMEADASRNAHTLNLSLFSPLTQEMDGLGYYHLTLAKSR